ncbi:hypothetical protein [Sphingomonas hankyongi]|uniref:Uncharacterized protein n=1 Tax=Sphingomonas hankyongi TaxID=2908209 RepID=A0ABT0RZK9_9SPHN|nr:hypothetical protein [Sphingomonas hankyongi]MCL6729047.1 hypothetical protein [Sphingomonas hankyongi]
MTMGTFIEIAAGVALGAGAVWLYRGRAKQDGNYGSQTAVLLLIIAAILLIHAFGLLEYHPSQAEIEASRL